MTVINSYKTITLSYPSVIIHYHLPIFVIINFISLLLACLSSASHLMGLQGFTLMSTVHLSLHFFLELFRMLDFFVNGKMENPSKLSHK